MILAATMNAGEQSVADTAHEHAIARSALAMRLHCCDCCHLFYFIIHNICNITRTEMVAFY